ncbi:MAG: DUF3263 domain-containing protein [Acidimicrobiales bacterium]
MPLSEGDRALLAFEESWWKQPGTKADSIGAAFGISPSAYYRRLAMLLGSPDALAQWPLLVRRLRRNRAAMRRVRFEGVAAPTHHPAR